MIDIPRIIVGASSLGSVVPLGPPAPRTLRFLDEVFELGLVAFDLAASYQLGGTERLFGAWMAARKNRDRAFIITKGAHPIPIVAPRRLTARALEDDLHASLRRLRTDHVDLYLIHRDDAPAPLEPVVFAMQRFHREGKIRAWGVSNFTRDRIAAIDAIARGGECVAASSTHFSLFEWARGRTPFAGSISAAGDAHRDARAFHESTKLPLLAWSPLGAGFAAGHVSRAYDCEANRERLRRAEKIAKARSVSPAQVALAYVLCQPFPTSAIVASRDVSRMRENLNATKIALTTDDVRWLELGGYSASAGSS